MNEKLAEILIDTLELNDGDIDESLTLADIEVWDSFTHVTLIVAIEDSFDIFLDPAKALEVKNIADICELVKACGIDV